MKSISLTKVKSMRKERNGDLIKRMKSGDQLSSFDSHASWYPPRPIIEKDPRAIAELYGKSGNKKPTNIETVNAAENTEEPLRLA